MAVGEKSVIPAERHGQNGLETMSYWQHRLHPSRPKKKQPLTIPQIKELLLDRHEFVAEEIVKITVEEGEIHGYAKEEGEWHKFTIYKY